MNRVSSSTAGVDISGSPIDWANELRRESRRELRDRDSPRWAGHVLGKKFNSNHLTASNRRGASAAVDGREVKIEPPSVTEERVFDRVPSRAGLFPLSRVRHPARIHNNAPKTAPHSCTRG